MRPLLLSIALLAAATAQTPPPSGQLIDVGGYRVHLYCTGEGSPTVFIAGAGFSFDWALVQADVARFTRVCTYDPSGSAWSDPGPGVTCPQRVAEIHQLLKNSRIEGPYVLTGLSVGALITRYYAHQFPADVAGMVIVDHAFLHPVDDPPRRSTITAPGLDSPPVLIHQEPIVFTVEDISDFNNLPERSRQLHRWAMSLDPVLPTFEFAAKCSSEVEAAEKRPDPLGDLPLVVVSTANDSPNYPKLQARLRLLSHTSKQLIASRSFHAVEIDQPDVIVNAIRQVVDAARSHTKLSAVP
jgi:pimeloyl-ACP methyl ester carboxylesterase